MMKLEDYLKQRYTAATAAAYARDIGIYTGSQKAAHQASHADVVAYIGALRNRYGHQSHTVHRCLAAIKVYYAYLCASGRRKDNPARSIRLRDKKSRDVQLQDLFSEEELERLLEKKEHHQGLSCRNKVLTGLLIYQGLQPGEIEQLQVEDINLEEGTVKVRQTPRTNGRTLGLRGPQVMLLHQYLSDIRPGLLKGAESEILLIGERGNPMSRQDITKHVKRSFKGWRWAGAGRRTVNCQTIRQSVIANLLKKGTDLRVVQVFAGHKWASTTGRYRQSEAEALKSALLKHHPFA